MTLSSVNTIAATIATITPGPLLHAKRDSATCGFISGNSGTIIVEIRTSSLSELPHQHGQLPVAPDIAASRLGPIQANVLHAATKRTARTTGAIARATNKPISAED